MQTLAQTPGLLLGLFAIAVVVIAGIISDLRQRRQDPDSKKPVVRQYIKTGLILWGLCFTCLACWHASDLPLSQIGLQAGSGWGAMLAWGLAGLTVLYALHALISASLDRKTRNKLRNDLAGAEGFDLLRPNSRSEHYGFQALSVTAGVTEEIIFRGFLIATLAMVMPIWAAALAAIALFIVAHAYQGISGMLRILPVTLFMTAVVVVGGSLWPAIIIHILVDSLAGALVALSDAHERADALVAHEERSLGSQPA